MILESKINIWRKILIKSLLISIKSKKHKKIIKNNYKKNVKILLSMVKYQIHHQKSKENYKKQYKDNNVNDATQTLKTSQNS